MGASLLFGTRNCLTSARERGGLGHLTAVSIRGNIASLQAQRRLSGATDVLSSARERLASGTRINRASDDAAGLSVASSLQINSRVFTQALRNIDDAVSLLNVAEGSVQQLAAITLRQNELAQQAANGSYHTAQRQALHAEANALRDEYSRILSSTQFNGLSLFNEGSATSCRIQAGFGLEAGLTVDLGKGLARPIGDGSFTQVATLSTVVNSVNLDAGDVNGDGHNDIVAISAFNRTVQVFLGNGTGSFRAAQTFGGGGNGGASLVDLNQDGNLDLLSGSTSDSAVRVALGNGNGSFKAVTS